ncbi:class I SAM-dependent methyltransferase [Bradyrhizobium hipponense]|uniref:class I SAM-dependent methyltransferase n=1 Tax=Bradyrhizobium hipponense TaxID=2605638 RepID=UPI001652CF29|nr:class I SAM-dependent methyltransferase [Bradyrhizobium hipponense]
MDGTVAFYQRVNALVDRDSVVVDFGAGRGVGHIELGSPYSRALRNLKGKVSKVIGVDVDEAVLSNPSVDQAYLLDRDGSCQLQDEIADLIFSDFTFEHIPDPATSARELERLLKPGGWLCARTPNKYGYIGLANQLVPEAIARTVLKAAQPERKEEDIFPAVYRLNTRRALLKHFPSSQFEHFVYTWDAEPGYHANRPIIYRTFKVLQYLTPPPLKTIYMIFLRKRTDSGRSR